MFTACILMAGSGARCGLSYNKAIHKINDKPLFMYSLETFLSCPDLAEIILVVSEEEFENYDFSFIEEIDIPVNVVLGGSTRLESSYIGCDNASYDIILVHDAARPLITKEDITNIYNLAKSHDLVVSGTKIYDSAKLLKEGRFNANINREELFLSSTPQAVHKEMYLDLVDELNDLSLTDEASVYEKSGTYNTSYYFLQSDNRKLTTINDLKYIEDKLKIVPSEYRIGHSKDTHRFGPGSSFKLGGIEIPHQFGIIAHSDGDALLHAITEAILGSVSLGDIGTHFPDNDPKYKGMDSSFFLKKAHELLINSGYEIVNIDTMIYLERPKLKNYKPLIQEKIANLLNLDITQVSIKATTKEGLGIIGEGKAVEAEATVLVRRF